VVLRLRFLHDGEDFASAYIRNAQVGKRVLSAASLLTDRGDVHDHLDHPEDLVFEADDFRMRYELTGESAAAADIGDGRFELRAGAYRAVIHTAPGCFGPHPIAWEAGGDDGKAWVDAVVGSGSARAFDFKAFAETTIVGGLELLETDEAPTAVALQVEKQADDFYEASWSVPGELRVRAPLRPHICSHVE
jgi:hypothetical protein